MVCINLLYDVFCYLDAAELDFMEQVDSQFKALRLRYFSKFPLNRVEVFRRRVRRRVLELVESVQMDDTTENQIVQTIVEILKGVTNVSDSVQWDPTSPLLLKFRIQNMLKFAGDIETRYHHNMAVPELNLKLGKISLSRGIIFKHDKENYSFPWHFLRFDVCRKLKNKYREVDSPVLSAICAMLSSPYTAEGNVNVEWKLCLSFSIQNKVTLARSVREAYGIACTQNTVDEELRGSPDISYSNELYSIEMI